MNGKIASYLLASFIVVLLLSACSGAQDRKERYFDRGVKLYEQGNYVKARLEFKNVLQIDPKDPRAYYMSGQIEEKEQNWRKAYALFLRAVELDPKYAKAQVRLGRLYALSGKPEKALEAAAVALGIDPNDSTALALRGLARLRMGEKESAISELESALEVDPNNLDALSLLSSLYADQNRLDKAIALAKRGLEQHPDRIASHLLLGQLYEKSGNSEGALEILQLIIRQEPDELQHRIRLAAYHLAKNQASEAKRVLEQAVQELPENPDAKLALVEFLRGQGEKPEAETMLKRFAAEAPEAYSLQLALANLYAQTERKEGAKAILREVIQQADRDQDGVKARVMLAKLLLADNLKDQALKQVQNALQVNRKEEEALLLRAAIYLANDDPAGSIADLRTLLKEDPSYVKAYRLKARVHLKKNEIALARQSLEEAIKVQPQEAAANFELVSLLVKTGEVDDAIIVLEKMRRYAPDDLEVLGTLAQLYSKEQNWDQVKRLASTLQVKHPDSALGYFYTGLALQKAGEHLKAINYFEQSLVRQPNTTELLIALSKSQLAIGQPEDALENVQSVINAEPDNILALNLSGEILLAQKQYPEAEIVFEKVIDLKPQWAVPYKNLLKLKFIEKDEDAILAVLRQGFENSKDARLGLVLASHYEKMGNDREARQVYERLLQQRTGYALAANNLAMLLIRDEPDQSALDKALNLMKDFELSENPYYLDTLGWTYIKRGEPDRAVPVLERARRIESRIPEIDYHLGLAYHQLGRTDEAVEKLKLATASTSQFEGHEEAKKLLQELQ